MKQSIVLSFICLLVLFGSKAAFAKSAELDKASLAALAKLEDSMVVMADSMISEPIPDYRIDFCVRFTKQLRTALAIPNSFKYPFAKLAEKIHIIYPEDKSFRIFNWLIAPSEDVRRYYGVIQMDEQEAKYYPLIDDSDQMPSPETQVTDNKHWYGCEIYKIMEQNTSNGKGYLLFGYNSSGASSSKKLIDVLRIGDDAVSLGAPIFIMPDIKERMVRQNRVILEYKKSATIYLNYDAERKMILFNRLASEVTDPNRKSTYIPTGQMDGLRWNNGVFEFVKDAMPVLHLQDGQAPIDGVLK